MSWKERIMEALADSSDQTVIRLVTQTRLFCHTPVATWWFSQDELLRVARHVR